MPSRSSNGAGTAAEVAGTTVPGTNRSHTNAFAVAAAAVTLAPVPALRLVLGPAEAVGAEARLLRHPAGGRLAVSAPTDDTEGALLRLVVSLVERPHDQRQGA
jgi:hypothetical protein